MIAQACDHGVVHMSSAGISQGKIALAFSERARQNSEIVNRRVSDVATEATRDFLSVDLQLRIDRMKDLSVEPIQRDLISCQVNIVTESDGRETFAERSSLSFELTRREAIGASVAAWIAALATSSVAANVPVLQRERPRAGLIALTNGLVYSGMCSTDSTLAPRRIGQAEVDRPDQKLLLRVIDQARERDLRQRSQQQGTGV